MDMRVAVQRQRAYALAALLGMAFFPADTKRTILGWLVEPKGPAHRLELKVRDFPMGQFDSTLVESRLLERMGDKPLWYAESYSDGSFLVLRDVGQLAAQCGWTETEMNSTTVVSRSRKRAKRCAYIPHSMGLEVRPNSSPALDPSPNRLF